MIQFNRRGFITTTMAAGCAVVLDGPVLIAADKPQARKKMAFGLVTYLWGADWDLPTLIANCEQSGALGVELRTTHQHGVEPSLNEVQRKEVKRRFADSPVTLAGIGSNERFDNPDAAVVKKAIEQTKQYVVLSHDVGSTGVKVKPDRLHESVPREKTIEQIGKSLNEVGKFAGDYGQQIRLEVHGGCAELSTIKAIMDVADNENVTVCWNCNAQDLAGKGLEYNFNLVRDRFGDTCHVHQLEDTKYPYEKLFQLLVKTGYTGWILLEASGKPKDRVAALKQQRALFDKLVSQSKDSR